METEMEEENKPKITVNSVVQANEKAKEWTGCLLQVSEVKEFGILGWIQIPFQGSAYIRLKWEQIEYIGQAVLGRPKTEEA